MMCNFARGSIGLELYKKTASDLSMSKNEFARTLGRRIPPTTGPVRPPTEQQRAWVRQMSRRRTRVPKGIFRYASMEQANADWEHWHAEMVTTAVSVE